LLRKIHETIFGYMRFHQFMKPFVIAMHVMIIVVAIINIIMIGSEITFGEYAITLTLMLIGGNIFLKIWELIYIGLLKAAGRKIE